MALWLVLVEENKNLKDPEEIERALEFGEFIRNGALQHFTSSHVLTFVIK